MCAALLLPYFYIINRRTAGMGKRELDSTRCISPLQSPLGEDAAADAKELKASIKHNGEF